MKLHVKKVSGLVLATVLVSNMLMLPVDAQGIPNTKEEVIYVLLEEDGTTKDVYVVNNIVVKEGKVRDYGQYRTIRNLNTEDKIVQENNQITIATDADRVYYEGVLDTYVLPWEITILYTLNGQPIEAKELAGEEGELTISIAVRGNKEANPSFYENYALQIATTLDTNKCSDIQTKGGTVATVGENKNIVYTHLPNKEETYTITTTVKDFEMAPISINATPFSMNVDFSEMVDLEPYVEPLQEGLMKLVNSVGDLHTGSQELLEAMASLEANGPTLVNGSVEVKKALAQINTELVKIQKLTALDGPIDKLQKGASTYLKGVQEIGGKMEPLVGASGKIHEGLKGSEQMLGALATDTEEIQKLLDSLKEMNNPQVNALLNLYTQKMGVVAQVSEQMGGITEKYSLFDGQIKELGRAVTTLASQYETINKGIESLTSSLDSFEVLSKSMMALVSQYDTLHTGLTLYTDSFGKIYAGYESLSEGITLLSDATGEIQEKTSSIGKNEEKEATIYTPESFVSNQNTEVTSVQFVMKTQEIKKEAVKEVTVEQPKKPSFWEKLKSLFIRA